MMASALVGCDVLPAAAHLTASMLSGAHPTVKYVQSSILTVAYGKQPDGAIALGSLDLLDPQGVFNILAITAKAAEGLGEAEKETWRSLPHESFDVVIMNPPFTRATGHEGQKVGVPNPMFAAFGSTEAEQKAMGKAIKRLTEHSSAHGNAGEASIFLVLAHRKLKDDGTLAVVMPLSLMSGESWEESRQLLASSYTDLVLASISGEATGGDLSFSADTGMGECLVVGRRAPEGSARATFVVLKERPPYPLIGASIAEQVLRLMGSGGIRHLEDGPVGGTQIHFGDDIVGHALDAALPSSGGWNLSRVADFSLAQAAYQMAKSGCIWLPTMNRSETIDIPITTVGEIGEIGPYHADVNGTTSSGGIRGPFAISAVAPGAAPTYPVLWAHDAEAERTMSFDADCEGIPRKTKTVGDQAVVERKVADIWSSASHCHFNRDFQFNSQSTAMQFTRRKTIGGRAWLSIQLPTVQQEKALVVWANTSLGLLLHWWHANKQQIGRGNVSKLALRSLPVLDVTALSERQLDQAERVFDALAMQELRPINEIEQDGVRHDLNQRFTASVLGLPSGVVDEALETLRMKLGREPSVRGRKEIATAMTRVS